MKKNVISAVIAALASAAALGALTACDSAADAAPPAAVTDTGLSVKAAYDEAASLGYDGTQDEFDALLAAADNGAELTVRTVQLNASGELVVTFTDGSYANLGKIGCVHSYSAWSVGAAPTCASLGYNVRTCSACGETDYEFLPAKGHTVAEYSHTLSMHSYFCSDCGLYIQEEHLFDGNVCEKCAYEAEYTVGLTYKYDEETDGYSVERNYTGKLDNADKIVVPSEYRNKPVTKIGDNAFANFKASEIILPDTITEIGDSTFRLCKKLTKITIPDGVTSISEAAFFGCYELSEIVLPDSIQTIGKQAFLRCLKLNNVNIPNGVTDIGITAFAHCQSLTEISIPDSVTEIGNGAFAGCTSLERVKLSDGLTEIIRGLFQRCVALTEIKLPDKINKIGNSAFAYCRNLTAVEIPDGVTEIGDQAFAQCTALTELKLPKSLTHLGSLALWDTKITKLALPDGVTALSERALKGMPELTELSVGAGLTNIHTGALENCPKLNKIIYDGTKAEWKAISKASGWKTPDNIITDLLVECADGTLEYIW